MDIGTIGGFVLGMVLILGSIGSGIGAFIDIPSVVITIGGAFSALLITYPVPKVKRAMGLTMKAINSEPYDLMPMYNELIELATIARRDGILALEEKIEALENQYLKNGLQMLVDGSAAEQVKTILDLEVELMEERHAVGQDMWGDMATYTPAFGMIGTLIGLVNMLSNLSDPAGVGAGMAVALLTTLYGAGFANLCCTPLQGKLAKNSSDEVALKTMLKCGIMGIQAGDSPRVLGEKLIVYIPPDERPTEETK